MTVSVIIVNFNGVDHTRRCVASVLRHSPQSEIIVVDNHSSDNSVEVLSHEFSQIVLVELKENSGYGYGCNMGAQNAKGKYLFFLNNDAYLTEDSITVLTDILEHHPAVCACGPKLVHPDGTFQLSFGLDPSIISEWMIRRRQSRLREGDKRYAENLERQFNKECTMDWVTGAALMVRRELFQAIGGFDERFFMYFEDADLCRRIRMQGFEVRYVPSTSVVHLLGQSLGNRRTRIAVEYRRSQIHYYRKHRSVFSRMVLRVYIFFRMLPYSFVVDDTHRTFDHVRKILVVKLCCIGDAVFLTPALRALRDGFPSASITYLATSWIKEIVEQIPYVDEVITFDTSYWKGRYFGKVIATFRHVRTLRREYFDVAIIGHRNKFFAFLGWIAGISIRVGFAADHQIFFLTHPVDFDPQMHEIKRYLDLVAEVNASSDNLETIISPPRTAQKNVDTLLDRYGIQENDFVIGILAGGGENPGTTMPIKRWNLASYSALCQKILSTYPVKILLIGSPEDKSLNDQLVKDLPDTGNRVHNIAGETSLRELPALLQRCHIVLGGDSGPTHIAAAVGCQTLFLFGPSDPRLVAPLRSNATYLWKHVHCSPCYTPTTVMQKQYFKGNTFICWTGTHECLDTMTVEEVFAAFEKIVARLGHQKN